VNLRLALRSALGVAVFILMLAPMPILLTFALFPNPSCTSDTVVRATSPSGRFEALLDEENCGATTSFAYVVGLRPVASSRADRINVASAYGAVRNDQAYGMNLVWVDENTLEVQYWKARWVTIEHPSISIDGVPVTTRKKADVRDESAPAGGMLVNIQRRSSG
jgi:hypothetical protein